MYVVLNIIIALKRFENSATCSVKMNHSLKYVVFLFYSYLNKTKINYIYRKLLSKDCNVPSK